MNSKSNISAILVVYNEEKKIRECLESLKNIVAEIIVIHDGKCSDKTLEICREYGSRIYIRKHIGEAEPHRPFAIEKTSKKWVLFIDADERLSKKLSKEVNFLTKLEFDAYKFKWTAKIKGEKTKFLSKQILFRKSKMYYIGLPHLQAETIGVTKKFLELELIHNTSEFDSPLKLFKSYIKKDKSWGKISARMLINFWKIPVFNCSLNDKKIKQIKKIKFIKNFTFLAIVIMPLYSFLNSFFMNKNYKQGFLGFVLSCHIPLHYFFTCWYLLLDKIKLIKLN
jgi:glycosyltransferase involved in cell wall biosynthesis